MTLTEFYKKYPEDNNWKEVKDFPKYLISTTGQVINRKTNKVIKPYQDARGNLIIGLYDDDCLQVRRNLFKLFCLSWGIDYKRNSNWK